MYTTELTTCHLSKEVGYQVQVPTRLWPGLHSCWLDLVELIQRLLLLVKLQHWTSFEILVLSSSRLQDLYAKQNENLLKAPLSFLHTCECLWFFSSNHKKSKMKTRVPYRQGEDFTFIMDERLSRAQKVRINFGKFIVTFQKTSQILCRAVGGGLPVHSHMFPCASSTHWDSGNRSLDLGELERALTGSNPLESFLHGQTFSLNFSLNYVIAGLCLLH